MSIGHYGGMFVEVPAEKMPSFKKRFPGRQFPRQVKVKTVQDMGFGIEFEEKFHRENPRSGGRYMNLYFADRSKGLKTLDDLISKHGCFRKIR